MSERAIERWRQTYVNKERLHNRKRVLARTHTLMNKTKIGMILHGITKRSTSSFPATQRSLPEHEVPWPGASHLEVRTVTLSRRPNSHLKSGSDESAE